MLESPLRNNNSVYPSWWGTEDIDKWNKFKILSQNSNMTLDNNENLQNNQDLYFPNNPNNQNNYAYRRQNIYNNRENKNLGPGTNNPEILRENIRKTHSPASTEVYINKNNNQRKQKKPRSKSYNKFNQNSSRSHNLNLHKNAVLHTFSNSDDFNQIIQNTESKIRPQVVHDKLIFKETQQQKDRINMRSPQEWRYNKDNSSHHSRATTPEKKSNYKTNYMIGYDKNLKPEVIREKSKEKNLSRQSRKDSQKSHIEKNSISEGNIYKNHNEMETLETAKFQRELEIPINKQQDYFIQENSENNHRSEENLNQNLRNEQENDNLSSYRYSDRIKSK